MPAWCHARIPAWQHVSVFGRQRDDSMLTCVTQSQHVNQVLTWERMPYEHHGLLTWQHHGTTSGWSFFPETCSGTCCLLRNLLHDLLQNALLNLHWELNFSTCFRTCTGPCSETCSTYWARPFGTSVHTNPPRLRMTSALSFLRSQFLNEKERPLPHSSWAGCRTEMRFWRTGSIEWIAHDVDIVCTWKAEGLSTHCRPGSPTTVV